MDFIIVQKIYLIEISIFDNTYLILKKMDPCIYVVIKPYFFGNGLTILL